MLMRCFVLGVWLVSVSPLAAAQLFHQGLDTNVPGKYSDYFFDGTSSQRVADDFQLVEDSIVRDLHWYGGFEDGVQVRSANFRVQFYDDDNGLPGQRPIYSADLQAQASPTAFVFPNGLPIQHFVISQLPVDLELDGQTTYWFSTGALTAAENEYLWASASPPGTIAYRGTDTEAWSISQPDQAFTITGVPEPTAATLLILATTLLLPPLRRLCRF